MIQVCEPTLKGNELKYVKDCLNTNWISSSGKYIEKFEEMFAKFCGVKYAVAVSNGTVAIHLALESLGIGKGDEVIVPNFTMIASVNAVLYTGAKPVFIDADKETWCIDTSLIENKITKRTKAIMPVHIYGNPCEMDKINQLAKKYNLFVIEDAAEAHGADYKGKKVGSLGDVACFSFYGNKIITTGEGGIIVTDNKKLAEKAKLLRNHAFTKRRFFHESIGFNYRMTNIQAAIGVAQMEQAERLVNSRVINANNYLTDLKEVNGIILPIEKTWAKNVYWMFGFLIHKEFGMSRDELREELSNRGIETRDFFYPMNKQPAFKNKGIKITGTYPISEVLSKNGLYLPSSSSLSFIDIRYITNTIKDIQKRGKK